MKAYVVVDKKGKIVKEAGIDFRREELCVEENCEDKNGNMVPTGEKIKSFTIPELK